MIGTPFVSGNEAEQRKVNRINKKPWEQEVRDEKGRRRFHGAFTGGFSAGYYNTVGSKEGWKPKDYEKGHKQGLMDFMDEEDITDQVGTHAIASRDPEFGGSNNMLVDSTSKGNSIDLGPTILDQFNLLPQMNSIQQTLMMGAGFPPESLESSSLSNQTRPSFKFKDNYEGVGYVKENELTYTQEHQKLFTISNSNIMRMNTFEDNESLGFYNERDVSDYNFEEVDVNESRRSTYNKGRQQELPYQMPTFIKSKQSLCMGLDEKEFQMPKVPDDFDFLEYIGQGKVKDADEGNSLPQRKCFDVDKRRDLLKIDIDPKHLARKFESQAEVINKKAKGMESLDQIKNVFNFQLDIPFKEDINKTSRFARFLAGKEGMTSKETASLDKEERMEFEKLYQTNSFIQSQSSHFLIKAPQSDPQRSSDEMTVTKTKWIPSHALCKKCKVKDPYEHSNSFNDIQKKCLKDSNHPHPSHSTHTPKDEKLLQKQNNEVNTKLLLEAEPDMNLFDAIFNS